MQMIHRTKILTSGVMAIFYFKRLIALLDEWGNIAWRDEDYPLFLVEYIINYPTPQSKWN